MSGAVVSELCARVFEVLVEGGEVKDPELAEHLGSCMHCFRVMTDLRDAPRLASALRSESPALPEDDLFWQRLERRTVEATAAALAGSDARTDAARSDVADAPPSPAAVAPRRSRLGAITVGLVAAAAAAAVFAVGPGRHGLRGPSSSVAPTGAAAASMSLGDEPWAAADVGDLDRTALRRLLDRLGASAPGAWASSASDLADAPEAFVDDDTRVNDEIADLDGPALLRVAQSLERTRL